MPFEKWLPRQLPAPWRKTRGRALWTATGRLIDSVEDLLRQSILAGFPTKGSLDNVTNPALPVEALAPSDALDAIGADRQLPRASGEADATYAARLLVAWEQWKYGGSHYGLLRALDVAGYDDMVVVQQNGRFAKLVGSSGTVADLSLGSLMACVTRSNHPGWLFDWRDDFWTVFAIVFTADHANLQPNGDGSVSPGQAMLTLLATTWKQSKDIYDGAAVILAGQILGWPTGRQLGTDPNLGTNSVRKIPGDGSPSFVVGP